MAIYTRRQRATGVLTTVARAAEIGADPDGGEWVTLCEEHFTLVNTDTRQTALAVDTRDFCDQCRELLCD